MKKKQKELGELFVDLDTSDDDADKAEHGKEASRSEAKEDDTQMKAE